MFVNVFDNTYIDGCIYQHNVLLLIGLICIIIYGLTDNLCYETTDASKKLIDVSKKVLQLIAHISYFSGFYQM